MSQAKGRISGRLLGLDHGNKRIGLAVSDATGLIARELRVIHRKSKREDFALLANIAKQERVVALVIGLPRNLDLAERAPDLHQHADTVLNWVEALKTAISHLPVVLWDETMSSVDAKELARERRRKWNEPIDDLAARVILQSYLDAVRDGLAEAPPATAQARPPDPPISPRP